jgi:hypothetical protein
MRTRVLLGAAFATFFAAQAVPSNVWALSTVAECNDAHKACLQRCSIATSVPLRNACRDGCQRDVNSCYWASTDGPNASKGLTLDPGSGPTRPPTVFGKGKGKGTVAPSLQQGTVAP